MKTHQPPTKESNPRAISVRIKPLTFGRITGQRNHDLRLGRQPNYVDLTRTHLNETIISPLPAPELKRMCVERREKRETKRQIKKNASIATCGIITFGTDAQVKFEALDLPTQAAAMRAVAEAIAERLQTLLTGLVIHKDETSTHAHFWLLAVNEHGHPLSQANSLSDISRLQDLAADTIARFEPSIERGHKKRDRLAAGASFSETVHRTVKELHRDLPLELEQKRKRVAEMEMRVAELEAKAELSLAENKRLEVYRKRYQDRIAELTGVESEMRAAADALMEQEKAKIRAEAEADAATIIQSGQDSFDAALDGFSLVLEGKIEPSISDGRRTWRPKGKVDDAAITRFKLGGRMFGPLFDRLHAIITALHDKLARLSRLVQDLEAMRAEMTEPQRQKLDQAQTELEVPSPFQ